MSNKHNSLDSLFSAIADAIRTAGKTTGKIVADDFPDRILELGSVDIYSTLKTESFKGANMMLTDVMVLGVMVTATTSSEPDIVSLPTTATGSKHYSTDNFNLTITRTSVSGSLPNAISSRVYVTYAEL